MNLLGKYESDDAVCNADRNGRILNSDYSSRISNVLPFRRPSGVRRLNMLSDLKVGECGVLVALELPASVQNHLMHMGFVPDALVTALRRAPAGDPVVYGVDGMEIALRHETAERIRMKALPAVTDLPDSEKDTNPCACSCARLSETCDAEEVQELAEAAR